jgi:hypothetical protein
MSSGKSYQMINNRHLIAATDVFKAASIHFKAMHCTAFSRTCQNMWASNAVTATCHEIFNSPGRDCVNLLLQVSAQEKIHQLDKATEEVMQSALHVQSTFLDMLLSTTAGYLPHSMLELCVTLTDTSLSSSDRTLSRKSVSQKSNR